MQTCYAHSSWGSILFFTSKWDKTYFYALGQFLYENKLSVELGRILGYKKGLIEAHGSMTPVEGVNCLNLAHEPRTDRRAHQVAF